MINDSDTTTNYNNTLLSRAFDANSAIFRIRKESAKFTPTDDIPHCILRHSITNYDRNSFLQRPASRSNLD